jgi:predicted transcriptional regulator
VNEVATVLNDNLLSLTATIVAARVSNAQMPQEDVGTLITAVYKSLAELGKPVEEVQEEERPAPAVPIKKSVNPDYIICLEDGKKLKMLKRHLMTSYEMTPDQYRARWNLPSDYPMVAPNYAEHRSVLAKKIGLGHSRTKEVEPIAAGVKKPVGRPRRVAAAA